jgi:hypothetical protein
VPQNPGEWNERGAEFLPGHLGANYLLSRRRNDRPDLRPLSSLASTPLAFMSERQSYT